MGREGRRGRGNSVRAMPAAVDQARRQVGCANVVPLCLSGKVHMHVQHTHCRPACTTTDIRLLLQAAILGNADSACMSTARIIGPHKLSSTPTYVCTAHFCAQPARTVGTECSMPEMNARSLQSKGAVKGGGAACQSLMHGVMSKGMCIRMDVNVPIGGQGSGCMWPGWPGRASRPLHRPA